MNGVYLVVTPFFPAPGNWRGAYCFDFVQALKRVGKWRVEVFVPGDGDDYEYQGIRVHRFRERKLPSGIWQFVWSNWNQRSFLSAVVQTGIDLNDVDVCHAHTAPFGVYALAVKRRNPRCKTLLHHHDPASFGLRGSRFRHWWFQKFPMFFWLRAIHDEIDCHVFISQMVGRSFRKFPDTEWSALEDYRKLSRGLGRFRGVRVKNSIVLHNGVDISVFRSLSKIEHEGFVVGCVANLDEWKDPITLVRAVGKLKGYDVRLKVVGSGVDVPRMKEEADRLGVNMVIMPEVDHARLPEFYRGLDLFVLPSYFEGFGCVFTEAHACGVPFITCEGQGMDDLILPEDRVLWLCKPKDPLDLAAKILYYIRHRPIQRLAEDQDIDKLVGTFVEKVLQ